MEEIGRARLRGTARSRSSGTNRSGGSGREVAAVPAQRSSHVAVEVVDPLHVLPHRQAARRRDEGTHCRMELEVAEQRGRSAPLHPDHDEVRQCSEVCREHRPGPDRRPYARTCEPAHGRPGDIGSHRFEGYRSALRLGRDPTLRDDQVLIKSLWCATPACDNTQTKIDQFAEFREAISDGWRR
jgi:hypothetical protein